VKLFVILLIVAAIWVGMKIYNEGADNVFGGAFAPLESVRDDDYDGDAGTGLTGAAQEADVPSQPRSTGPRGGVPITQHVRQRVTRDLQQGAKRRGP
jgi:hypothetical protein